jgi:hypothetical protein
MSVIDLYSPRIGLHIFSSRIGRPIVGIQIDHRRMNMEIGTETPIFLFWEYLFQNFGILSLQCILIFGWNGRIWVRHCCCVLARCLGKEAKCSFLVLAYLTLLNYIFGALNFFNTYVAEIPLPGNGIRLLSKTQSSV